MFSASILITLSILFSPTKSCTTVVVSSLASKNNGAMCSHSNDGDGDVAGTLRHVKAAIHPPNSNRSVSGGSIPQVNHTYQYKTEGYSVMNEFSVGLCESTCTSVFDATKGFGQKGILNIVDLSQLALERSKTAVEAVQVMGSLAVKYGYHDMGESMLVVDPTDAWIFHILPDDTNASAIWVAQQLVGSEIATVANAFIIQNVEFPLDGSTHFLGSSNLKSIAMKYGWWKSSDEEFNFSYIYSLGELGPKYNSGRRMYESFKILAPEKVFSPTYDHFLPPNAPYPTTVSVGIRSISPQLLFQVMRSFYQNSPYDLTKGLASGPFGNPFRAHPGAGSLVFPNGRWERSIATWKTQVSYIITPYNGFIWFAPHAAHTSVYLPFHVTLPTTSSVQGPVSMNIVNRSTAFWVNRYVFHLSQLNFNHAYVDIDTIRKPIEQNSFMLVHNYSINVVSHPSKVTQIMNDNANAIISKWNDLSEKLIVKYGEGNCNGCGPNIPRHLGYPSWWLKDVGFDHPMPLKRINNVYGERKSETSTKHYRAGLSTGVSITTVLITGATGRTGTALYQQLKTSPAICLRGLVRNISKARERLGCNKCDASEGIYVGDVTKIKTLASAFENVNVVVIITGSYPIQLKNGSFVYPTGGTPREVDYLGTNNQVITSVQAKTVQRIVLVSSMGTTTPGSFLDLLGNGYALSYKLNAEVNLIQSCQEFSMSYTIVKPSGLLPATGHETNSSYLIGHSDRLACLECMNISRSDVANVLYKMVTNLSLFQNTRFDISSNPSIDVSHRDWNKLSKQAANIEYP